MQAVLAYYGFDVNEKKIMDIAGTKKSGTSVNGIKRVVKKYGLKCKLKKFNIAQVKQYIQKRIPVILLIQAWTEKKIDWGKNWIDGHYVVAIGYDREKIYFEDPSSVLRTYLYFEELKKRWHDMDTNGRKYSNFGIVVYGKKGYYNPSRAIHMD